MTAYRPSEAVAHASLGSLEFFLFQGANGVLQACTRPDKNATLSSPDTVGGVKSGAPVMLTVLPAASADKTQTVVALAVGTDGLLKNFIYDADEGEWTAGGLHDAGVAAREDAEFSAAADGSHTYVFAVTKPDTPGGIVVTSSAGGGAFGPPKAVGAAHPAAKASVFATVVAGGVTAFYTHADSSIHRLTMVNGEWQDSEVPGTKDGAKKFNVSSAPKADERGYTLQWANEKMEVFSLLPEGKIAKFGEIAGDGTVKKASDAQAWYYEEMIVVIRRWWWY